MNLSATDSIVAVAPERFAGPGWANAPLTVYVQDTGGKIRRECIQPDEMSAEIVYLFDVCNAAHIAMTAAVKRMVAAKKPRRKRPR